MAKYFARIKRPSLRWGLMFGIILGIMEAGYSFATSSVTDQNAQMILGYIPAILFLVLGFYAGMRAAQETGKWTSGLIAGLWVGLIGTLIADLVPLVNSVVNMQNIITTMRANIKANEGQYNNMKPADFGTSDVFIGDLLEIAVSVINAAFFTIVGGALGGFLGRRRALALESTSASTYKEAMFQAPTTNEPAEESIVEEEVTIEVKNKTQK